MLMTLVDNTYISSQYNYINEFNKIKKTFDKLKNKQFQIMETSHISEEDKNFFKSYISNNNINKEYYIEEPKRIVENKLYKLQLDKDKIHELLKLRHELLKLELDYIEKNTIESSYIFEKSFFSDIEKDIKLSQINNDFSDKKNFEEIISNYVELKKNNSIKPNFTLINS
ncbi:hypothetical protein KFV05_05080 [Macrococcoides canis]|uniref:hypothetical protein n=1 Tax=Macrococcoides canis TaxID=1855823 RepID=UPI0020B7EB7B|nr:hypothetical protein [Macrococcus canis]UTH03362.1 hypothetical protein KFV05_05080 [Macrococcus canis]